MTNLEYNQLSERVEILKTRIAHLELLHSNHEVVLLTIDESRGELARIENTLSTKREYLYNFVSGGWNSEYAFTRELAIAQANERWGGAMEADPTTFRVSTPSDYQNLLSLFY